MQIGEFRQFFLCQIPHVAFAADVRAHSLDVNPVSF